MLEHAKIDYLTEFYARDSLVRFLEELICDSSVSKRGFSMALIDLDRFKRFNDKYGHSFGDEILKYSAGMLRLTFAETRCYLFRYGGDEFIAVFPEREPREALSLFRQCIYNLTHRPFLFKNKFYGITISCGIVGFPNDGKTIEQLIQKADEGMYFSKSHGRNRITLASNMMGLKLRNAFMLFCSVCIIIGSLAVFYKQSIREFGAPLLDQIKSVRIVTEPTDLDTIILTNGRVMKGRVIEETEHTVILKLYIPRGEGLSEFPRSAILKIEYGPATIPQVRVKSKLKASEVPGRR